MRILSKLSRILLSVHYFCTKKQQTRSHSYTTAPTHCQFLIQMQTALHIHRQKHTRAHTPTPINKKRKQSRLQCILYIYLRASQQRYRQPSPLKRSTFSHPSHYRTTHPHFMCNAYLLQHEQTNDGYFHSLSG